MFLMWQPLMPDSIPITLGYVKWHTFFGADQGTRDSTFADTSADPFVKANNYPTWDKVAKNGPSPWIFGPKEWQHDSEDWPLSLVVVLGCIDGNLAQLPRFFGGAPHEGKTCSFPNQKGNRHLKSSLIA